MTESTVIINGRRLDRGQAATVRVAITSLLDDMTPTNCRPFPLGADEHGQAMARGYVARCREVLAMLTEGTK